MKLRVKDLSGLFLLSLFVVFTFSGCGSSSSHSEKKLVSMGSDIEGYKSQSLYTYDGQGHLTSLYMKVDDDRPKKELAADASRAIEFKLEYDADGNAVQAQIWLYDYTGENLVDSSLDEQYTYTYTGNKLTESVCSYPDGPDAMVEGEKTTYEYDEDGDLIRVEVYQNNDGPSKAFAETPVETLTMTYDLNKNMTQVEKVNLNSGNGSTYVMTYNTDNQMVKHERYNVLAGVIVEGPPYTYELTYDSASTVTVTGPDTIIRYGVSPRDIGYRLFEIGWGITLIPAEFMETLIMGHDPDYLIDPESLLFAKKLVTGRTKIDEDTSEETTFFDINLDGNGYPQTMTFYGAIYIEENVYSDLDFNFIWE